MWDGIPSLLQAWRTEVAHMTLAEVARRTESATPRSKSTIGAWESGRNAIDADGLRQLDDCYGADGALVGLARALQTPTALAARLEWAHNFEPPAGPARWNGGPVWAWLRPGPDRPEHVRAALWWGVLGVKVNRACGPDGLFVSCPVSVEHPATFVQMADAPGWADFGRGVIPSGLGVPVLAALPRLQFFGVRQAAVSAFSDALHSVLGSTRLFERLATFAGARSDVIQQAIIRFAAKPEVKDLVDTKKWHRGLDPTITFGPQDYRRLREARGLSQRDVARAVTELLATSPVNDDQIGRFEQGREPRAHGLRSRLDVLYGADGHTCWEPIEVAEVAPGQALITFPEYWVGPVTLSASTTGASDSIAHLTIHWDDWETHVQMQSGTTVAFRQSTPSARLVSVTYPASWRLRAGVGYDADAFDINSAWHLADAAARQSHFERLKPVYLGLFDKTPEEFERLERQRGDTA